MNLTSKNKGVIVLPLVILICVILAVLLAVYLKSSGSGSSSGGLDRPVETPLPKPLDKSDLVITKLPVGDVAFSLVTSNNKYVVWVDYGNNTIKNCITGNIAHQPCLSQVYLYDIKGKTLERISGVNQWISSLELFENTVMWEESTNQNAYYEQDSYLKRVLYNISTKRLEDITGEEGKRVSGNEIAYIKNSQTGSQGTTSISSVYLLDLNSKKENEVIEVSKPSDSAYGNLDGYSVSGDYVYYVVRYWDAGAPGSILYGKNLSSQDTTEIAKLYGLGGGDVHYTASNNLISWLEYASKDTAFKNGDLNLYVMDMRTKEKILIVKLKHSSLISPRINNNYVMYYSEREDVHYIYSLETKATTSFSGVRPWNMDQYQNEKEYLEDANKDITYFSVGGLLIRVIDSR